MRCLRERGCLRRASCRKRFSSSLRDLRRFVLAVGGGDDDGGGCDPDVFSSGVASDAKVMLSLLVVLEVIQQAVCIQSI